MLNSADYKRVEEIPFPGDCEEVSTLESILRSRFDLGTLVDSPLLNRLRDIGFLGILGPGPGHTTMDTRYNHTLGVTALACHIAERCELPISLSRYLLAATLLHDSANRALSHTCEGAFNSLTGITSRNLTTAIILRNRPSVVPQAYGVKRRLLKVGLDPQHVLLILAKRNVLPPNADISVPAELLGSPISPDTLDGISRACAIFGEDCPNPFELAEHFFLYSGRVVIRRESLEWFDAFWHAKNAVYQKHINSSVAVELEGCVAKSAKELFHGWKSDAIFRLTDEDVRDPLLSKCTGQMMSYSDLVQFSFLPPSAGLRFRDPMSYLVQSDACVDLDLIPVWELRKRYRTLPTSMLTPEQLHADQPRWNRCFHR